MRFKRCPYVWVHSLSYLADQAMSSYSQQTKRQKREKVAENVDYFQGIDKIEFNKMAGPSETATYRYYNGSERIQSRPMEEWLKYSVSFTHFRNNGSDARGKPTLNRPWDDHTNTIDNHKRCLKAFFEFCMKLGIKYWTAFDSDLIPYTDNWDEAKAYWDEVVEYVQELVQRYHVKLLWLAPDLHSHPRYSSGAMTSNDASTFVQAAAQIKKCVEIAQKLNAECFLLWPHREGYDAIFHTDVAKEIQLFAKLLKITAEYKDRLNYRCQLLLMPYNRPFGGNVHCGMWQHSQWREKEEFEVINSYIWDVTSCLYFLKHYNLDRYFKVCSPPGHHMFMASVYNMLGGVTISNDIDQYDGKSLTLLMKAIVDQGTPPGGVALRLVPRRDGDLRDLITTYIKYIDAIAKGLRFACSLITEQIFSKHIQQRYATYYSGFGSRLVSSDISMEECEEYYKKNQNPQSEVTSSKVEHLELMFQRYLDSCDHI